MRRLTRVTLAWALGASLGAACVPLTQEEAKVAVEEVKLATEAGELVGATVELSTDFTIGEGIERAAQTLADFAESQVPCSTITVSSGRVSVDFGELGDGCRFQGRTYAGTVTWTVESATPDAIVVRHEWTGFRNERAQVDGAATVTWDLGATTRQVVYEADWIVDGRSFSGDGDVTQSLLDPGAGIAGGIVIDGRRGWTSETGRWDLAIDSVGVRWEDPVPESGRYLLTTPQDKTLSLSFRRSDANTIEATARSGGRTFTFLVHRLGFVTST
ncbi:MAG: hypothetical protein H6744_12525 [Deltaproteobacteria bacterium]|nr:hypothetical protein [Deltaproteobacteria bacterium]MCB9787497.1 hypothetical protein [Deltaproteobacteria bacterium]